MFNIDELTYGQIKEIAKLACGTVSSSDSTKHPMIGKYCVVRTFSAGLHNSGHVLPAYVLRAFAV